MVEWYEQGLRFKCTGCGACCTGSPGYVWITEPEAMEMADFLKIPLTEFIRLYTRLVKGRLSLKEHPKTYDCVFLNGRKCQVYGARPTQCRTFPFWSDNLTTREEWAETAKRCEGIDHPDAPLISIDQIRKQRDE